ncbi:hypothetical protein TNCV_2028911 [Trichonephila clavipes]|nr:hypothetical protein TNCV_2028911 [Trichonephila clavipes]
MRDPRRGKVRCLVKKPVTKLSSFHQYLCSPKAKKITPRRGMRHYNLQNGGADTGLNTGTIRKPEKSQINFKRRGGKFKFLDLDRGQRSTPYSCSVKDDWLNNRIIPVSLEKYAGD